MKLFSPDTFFIYRITLKGDIKLLLYIDLDNRGRPDCFLQSLKIGKLDSIPLKIPLLIFNFPAISGLYDKRELVYIIREIVERKKYYLERFGERLGKEIEQSILKGEIYYDSKLDNVEKQGISQMYRRFLIVMAFLLGGDGGIDETDEEKKPP